VTHPDRFIFELSTLANWASDAGADRLPPLLSAPLAGLWWTALIGGGAGAVIVVAEEHEP
jgi:hypothetical protein